MTKVKQITQQSGALEEKGHDVEIVYSDSGRIKARIIASEVVKKAGNEPTTEFPKGLRLYIYGADMKVESRLSANYGITYDKKDELVVRDNVIIVNIEGKKFNSEELLWRRKDRKVYSDKFVKITTKDEIIYGKGFESDEQFTNYLIKQVTGTIMKENKDFDTNL